MRTMRQTFRPHPVHPAPGSRLAAAVRAVAALAVVLAGVSAARADTLDGEASAVIDGFHRDLIGVMKEAKTLGYEGRYQKIEPALGRTFDLEGGGGPSPQKIIREIRIHFDLPENLLYRHPDRACSDR